jgi:argininosuccinate lyase
MLQEAARQESNRDIKMSETEFLNALSAENFVAVRTIYGGPSPIETKSALLEQREAAKKDTQWHSNASRLLSDAETNLKESIDNVLKD